jgi:hypothetical protein
LNEFSLDFNKLTIVCSITSDELGDNSHGFGGINFEVGALSEEIVNISAVSI